MRAAAGGPVRPGKVTIRCATEQDLDAILEIERAIPCAPHWSAAAYQNMLTTNSAEGRLRCVLVAVDQADESGTPAGDRVVGFVVVAAFATAAAGSGVPDARSPIEADLLPAELESVAVLEQIRKQGIGERLCRAAIEWAGRVGSTVMELEVRAHSRSAVDLYRRLGFRETGRRPRYYQDPQDDALLMSLSLRGAE